MLMNRLSPKTIPASQIEVKTAITHPVLTEEQLSQVVTSWFIKQRQSPPSETAIGRFSPLYLPFWNISGAGCCQWSAAIGIESPQALVWKRQSGVVETEVDIVLENYDEKVVNTYWGERPQNTDYQWLDRQKYGDYFVVCPKAATQSDGNAVAKQTIIDALHSRARYEALGQGRVRDLRFSSLKITRLTAHLWLYPIYWGFYNEKNGRLFILIDGITGEIWPIITHVSMQKKILVIVTVVLLVTAVAYILWQVNGNSQLNF